MSTLKESVILYLKEQRMSKIITDDVANIFDEYDRPVMVEVQQQPQPIRRVRNFMSPRGISFITPHELSPEAKYLLRQGVDDFVKEVANKGYWDSCKAIDQEVDLEIIRRSNR